MFCSIDCQNYMVLISQYCVVFITKNAEFISPCFVVLIAKIIWMLQHWFICIIKIMLYIILVYMNTFRLSPKCGSCSVYPVNNSGVKTWKMFSFLIPLTYHFNHCTPFKGKHVFIIYVHTGGMGKYFMKCENWQKRNILYYTMHLLP